jgi:thiosulfate/3-mercaptopyruvate sulfurtransferase
MSEERSAALKSTQWLADHREDLEVRILDGSFHLPGSGRDAQAEFRRCHIPGAQFFDIDGIRDESSDLPHMLPSADAFAAKVGALDIGNDDHVVVYDVAAGSGAARVWWTFRVFGHRRVSVLDGGLGKWLAEGRPVSDSVAEVQPALYRAPAANRTLVRTCADLLANVPTRREQVVDNRAPGRFRGAEPEPRPARKLGHISGSINIPFVDFIAPGGVWRSEEEIAHVFARAGVDLGRPIVGTCGSGVTACTTALAAYLLGRDDVAVYDGSWVEWGNRDDTPVER